MMPRRERDDEWSKKSVVWQSRILKNANWKEKPYTFMDLIELGPSEWPKLIRPEAGWLGDDEETSFCGGDPLMGIGVRNFKRIGACQWDDKYTDISVIKKTAKSTHIIPLTTMTETRHKSMVKIMLIENENQVYPKMDDLWKYHPRYAMPKKTFTVGKVTVKRGETIELKNQINNCIICHIKLNDQTISVPMTVRGDFTIIPDQNNYTMQEIYDNFTFPQHVCFDYDSTPAGFFSNGLLLEETRYDVLITCILGSLFLDEREEDAWGTKEEDIMHSNLIFLPKPKDESSPTADIEFSTWTYDPRNRYCQTVMSRACMFNLDQFKDMNAVVKANCASMKCNAEDIYDYIKIHDFLGISPPEEPGPPPLPPTLPLGRFLL
jgi:hypothetical protein